MREVILLGSGPTHSECPYDTEVWGVNLVCRLNRRLDKLFFFDAYDEWPVNGLKDSDLINCSNKGVEIITTQRNKDLVSKLGIKVTLYPVDKIIKAFNSHYFANSVAYMLAYALWLKVDKLKIYGIDQFDIRYVYERCCVEYWLGRLEERGIDYQLSEGTALLKTLNGKLYGYNKFYNKSWQDECIV